MCKEDNVFGKSDGVALGVVNIRGPFGIEAVGNEVGFFNDLYSEFCRISGGDFRLSPCGIIAVGKLECRTLGSVSDFVDFVDFRSVVVGCREIKSSGFSEGVRPTAGESSVGYCLVLIGERQ